MLENEWYRKLNAHVWAAGAAPPAQAWRPPTYDDADFPRLPATPSWFSSLVPAKGPQAAADDTSGDQTSLDDRFVPAATMWSTGRHDDEAEDSFFVRELFKDRGPAAPFAAVSRRGHARRRVTISDDVAVLSVARDDALHVRLLTVFLNALPPIAHRTFGSDLADFSHRLADVLKSRGCDGAGHLRAIEKAVTEDPDTLERWVQFRNFADVIQVAKTYAF